MLLKHIFNIAISGFLHKEQNPKSNAKSPKVVFTKTASVTRWSQDNGDGCDPARNWWCLGMTGKGWCVLPPYYILHQSGSGFVAELSDDVVWRGLVAFVRTSSSRILVGVFILMYIQKIGYRTTSRNLASIGNLKLTYQFVWCQSMSLNYSTGYDLRRRLALTIVPLHVSRCSIRESVEFNLLRSKLPSFLGSLPNRGWNFVRV